MLFTCTRTHRSPHRGNAFERAAGAADREVAHRARGLGRQAQRLQFVFGEERAVEQREVRGLDQTRQRFVDGGIHRRDDDASSAGAVANAIGDDGAAPRRAAGVSGQQAGNVVRADFKALRDRRVDLRGDIGSVRLDGNPAVRVAIESFVRALGCEQRLRRGARDDDECVGALTQLAQTRPCDRRSRRSARSRETVWRAAPSATAPVLQPAVAVNRRPR